MNEQQWKEAALLYLKAYILIRWALYEEPPTVQRNSRILEAVNAAAALVAKVPREIIDELGRMDRADST